MPPRGLSALAAPAGGPGRGPYEYAHPLRPPFPAMGVTAFGGPLYSTVQESLCTARTVKCTRFSMEGPDLRLANFFPAVQNSSQKKLQRA